MICGICQETDGIICQACFSRQVGIFNEVLDFAKKQPGFDQLPSFIYLQAYLRGLEINGFY